MHRATTTSLSFAVGLALVLAGCSDGGGRAASAAATTSACPLLAQLAATGETVAHADIADPDKFDATLKTAVTDYVRTARRLQAVVPLSLRSDVADLENAARHYRFDDATAARASIDAYARSKCETSTSRSSS